MNYNTIAYKLIHQVMGVAPGEVISISGSIMNGNEDNPLCQIEFIEELAMTIRKAKAFPVIEMTTENLQKRFFNEISDDVMQQPVEYYSEWVRRIDGFIDLGWRNNPELFASISDKQYNNLESSATKIIENIELKNKKFLTLGFPTKAMSEYFSLDHKVMTKTYFESLNCDYQNLKIVSEKLIDLFYDKEDITIETNENEAILVPLMQEAIIMNGKLSDKGNEAFPPGKIAIPIKQMSYSGNFCFDYVSYKKKKFRDVTIKIKNGIIKTIMIPGEQEDDYKLKNFLTNLQPNLVMNIGFNENCKRFTYYPLFDSVADGIISINFKDDNDSECVGFIENGKINNNRISKIINEVRNNG